MKICPQCNSMFPDEERFCELDGTPLVSEDELLPASVSSPSRPRTNSILIVAAVLGLVVGVLPVLLYFSLTAKEGVQNSNHQPANSTIAQPQFPSTAFATEHRLQARVLQSNRHRRQVPNHRHRHKVVHSESS